MIFENLAIVQARTNSSRFPGKVLKKINEVPIIVFLLNRLVKSKNIDKIVLATSYEKSDDSLSKVVKSYGYQVFRGSLDDVLSRFYDCSELYKSKNIIRITGDCPLVDPFLVDELINEFNKENWDYLSNCADENRLSVPDGFDIEIFKSDVLRIAHSKAGLSSEREHVTPWFKTIGANLHWSHYVHNPIRRFFRVTLDYPEDFEVISSIIKNLNPTKELFSVDEVVQFLSRNPDISKKNCHFTRNFGYLKSLKEDNI